MGTSPLAVSETAIGVLTIIGVGVGLAGVRPLAWAVVALAFLLIVASSIAHVRKAMRLREVREASEAQRLASHLEAADDAKALEDADPPPPHTAGC